MLARFCLVVGGIPVEQPLESEGLGMSPGMRVCLVQNRHWKAAQRFMSWQDDAEKQALKDC